MSLVRSAFVLLALSSVLSAQSVIDATLPNGPPQVGAATLAPSNGSYLAQFSDDFNRPDAPTLGANWNVQVGSYSIITNRAVSTGSANQWVRHAVASTPAAQAVVAMDFLPSTTGPSLVYVAAVIGPGGFNDTLFCKVQDNNSDGNYDRVFFYMGINGGGWAPTYYFDLVTRLYLF